MAFLEWRNYGRLLNTDAWNQTLDQAKSVDLGRQIEHLASQALEEKPPWTNAHHIVLPGNKMMDLIVNCGLEDFEEKSGWKDPDLFLS